MTSDLLRHALAVNQAMLALGNETFEADGATFVRNRSVPEIRDSNHAARVTAAAVDEIDRLLKRADQEFASLPYRRFDVDVYTPVAFEARLAYEGYQHRDLLVMVVGGDLVGAPKAHDIRQVTGDAGWRAYDELNEIGWREYVEGQGRPEDAVLAGQMLRARRAKSPPARYWLGYVDGEPRAFCTSWEGTESVGQVDDLFTHAEARHRGLATALVRHAVADCRARGAGPVIIVADPGDTPKEMYAALGFRPLALLRHYWKGTGPAP